MSEAETLAVGKRRSDRPPAPWLFLAIGILVGALLGAMTVFLVVQAQRPDRAVEFMIDQRLKAYQAYADEVATANDLEDKAMAAVVPDLDAEDGDGPDPTGAKPEALAAVLSLYDGEDAPTTDDYRAVQRRIVEVRGKHAPATLVLAVRDELAASQ